MIGHNPSVFRFSDIEVQEAELSIRRNAEVLPVEPKAFRVLVHLLRNPGRLVPKEELIRAGWGDTAVTDNSLTRNIALLRRLLGDDPREPRFIETVSTVGYRFIGKLEVTEDGAGEPAMLQEPNPPNVQTKVESWKLRWSRGLAAGGLLVICLAGVIWYLHRPLPPPRISGYIQVTHDGRKKSLVGTDGTRLYFNQMAGPMMPVSIAEVAISGGGIAQVLVGFPNPHMLDASSGGELGMAGAYAAFPVPYLLDVSPDGSAFIIGGPNSSAWNVRILGGEARRLPDTFCAAFSPDGNAVVYSAPRDAVSLTEVDDVWLVRNDGTSPHRLASTGGEVCYLAWSPDGKTIRFSLDEKIWEMSSSGSGLHKIFPARHESSGECCGRWTPDGKFFVFISDGQIWALDERRGLFRQPAAEPIQLTQGPIRWGPPPSGKYYRWNLWAGPVPGRDGTKIFALGSIAHGEASRFDSKTQRFQPFLGGISAQGIAFSKDGKSISYVSYPEGTLWKANRDGSDPVQLTDAPMVAFLPRWSPDSRQILFLGNPFSNRSSPSNWANYVISSDGGNPQKLLPEGQDLAASTWSPDGHKIVGTARTAEGKNSCRIFDLDTRQFTDVPGSQGMFGARWSPDGRYLAAEDQETGKHLKIFDFKTRQWSELPQKGDVDSPEWSADSQFIYFRRVAGDLGAFRISIHGGGAEKVADLKDWRDAGWWGKFMGLDPTDAPLMLRDIGSEDIYALTLELR